MKVYLGGTAEGTTWRDDIKSQLVLDYFSPQDLDDDYSGYKKDREEWEACDYCLYVLSPKMIGFQEVVDVVDDSNKRPEKTLFCFLTKDDQSSFNEHQVKSLTAIGKMVDKNGARWFEALSEAVDFLNTKAKS